MTEAWFRNPSHYIREMVEAGTSRIVWWRGKLKNLGIDPSAFGDLYYPGAEYRALVIGLQGAAEIRPGYHMGRPAAVYPAWSYQHDDLDDFERLLRYPVSEDAALCDDDLRPPDECPVRGQEHRVVVMDLPEQNTGVGKKVGLEIAQMQAEYSDAIVHVTGLYGYKTAFGLGFGSVDVEPREYAAKGTIYLPMGKKIRHEDSPRYGTWVSLLGFTPGDLTVPRNRCIFNIKSAMWAGENYQENVRFRLRGGVKPDPDAIKASSTVRYRTGSSPAQPGDMVLCETCTLSKDCKYYREGAVCSVEGTQASALAGLFRTRNAQSVVTGLSQLMSMQADRLERGQRMEAMFDELDPEVTKIGNSLFANGVKLAKLLDPSLAGGPRTQVGVGVGVVVNAGQGQVGSGSVAEADPRALMAGFVQQLEQQGIPRDRITPKMLEAMLNGKGDQVIDVEEA